MNRDKAIEVRESLEKLIPDFRRQIEERTGEDFNITLGNISFKGSTLSVKLDLTELDANGIPKSAERDNFIKLCEQHGLKLSDLGRTFVVKDTPFKIVGLNPTNRLKKVVAESGGERYRFEACKVVKLLND